MERERDVKRRYLFVGRVVLVPVIFLRRTGGALVRVSSAVKVGSSHVEKAGALEHVHYDQAAVVAVRQPFLRSRTKPETTF